MKTIGLIIIAIVGNTVCAQINKSIIDTNKIWQNIETCQWGATPTVNKYFTRYSSDTLIGSHIYKKIIYSKSIEFDNSEIVGYARESNNKIYFMDINLKNEGLLYDFDISIGKDITIVNYFLNSSIQTLRVIIIDTVEINKQKIRKIQFQNSDEYWLEGIGSIYGLLNSGFRDTTSCFYDLACFKENSFVYTNPKYSNCDLINTFSKFSFMNTDNLCNIYPNPIEKEAVIKIEGTYFLKYQINIFSNCGKEIKSDYFYGNEYYLNGDDFKSGIYLFSISAEHTKFKGMFIKR